MIIRTAAIALVCGFIGAALYGRLFPAPTPYDYIAIAKYTDSAGKTLPPAQIDFINRRANQMAKDGYIILNASSMYLYPAKLNVPQNIIPGN